MEKTSCIVFSSIFNVNIVEVIYSISSLGPDMIFIGMWLSSNLTLSIPVVTFLKFRAVHLKNLCSTLLIFKHMFAVFKIVCKDMH